MITTPYLCPSRTAVRTLQRRPNRSPDPSCATFFSSPRRDFFMGVACCCEDESELRNTNGCELACGRLKRNRPIVQSHATHTPLLCTGRLGTVGSLLRRRIGSVPYRPGAKERRVVVAHSLHLTRRRKPLSSAARANTWWGDTPSTTGRTTFGIPFRALAVRNLFLHPPDIARANRRPGFHRSRRPQATLRGA